MAGFSWTALLRAELKSRSFWQMRRASSDHCLADAPDVQQVLNNSDGINSTAAKEVLFQYVDTIISTINPAVLPDGSSVDEASSSRPTPTPVT